MRLIRCLYLTPMVFFLCGVGLPSADARTAQESPPFMTPVADVLQIMNGLSVPASDVVFTAVSTVLSSTGVEEIAPNGDEEWQAVEDSAAMLVESGNLLLIGNRVRDQDDWIEMSRAFIDASIVAMEAARAQDAEALFSSYDVLYLTCERCHLKYFE